MYRVSYRISALSYRLNFAIFAAFVPKYFARVQIFCKLRLTVEHEIRSDFLSSRAARSASTCLIRSACISPVARPGLTAALCVPKSTITDSIYLFDARKVRIKRFIFKRMKFRKIFVAFAKRSAACVSLIRAKDTSGFRLEGISLHFRLAFLAEFSTCTLDTFFVDFASTVEFVYRLAVAFFAHESVAKLEAVAAICLFCG